MMCTCVEAAAPPVAGCADLCMSQVCCEAWRAHAAVCCPEARLAVVALDTYCSQ